MRGELVSATTADRVRLDGFLVSAVGERRTAIDGAVVVHGLAGNFYSSRFLKHIATTLSELGIDVVVVNTRGHEYLNVTVRSGRSQTLGAAVEEVDECRWDLAAWADFLAQRGCDHILLNGHSLGAIKTLYAQAHAPHPRVIAVSGYSATRLSYDALLGSPGGERFQKWLEQARQWVAEGRGEDLLHVDFPFPTWISARAYLAKYAADEKFNWLTFAPLITTPVWLGFGQLELDENPAFIDLRPELDRIRIELANYTIKEIEGADHFYSARFSAATEPLVQWLRSSFKDVNGSI